MVADSRALESGAVMSATAVEPRDISQMLKKSPTLRVLIVDDEALIRWSLAETLGECGFDVVEAGDGQSAVSAIGEVARPIDVILLDYRLPDSNDLNLLATLKRLAPKTQVILMTAYGTPEVARGALELGAFRVVSKPFEMQDLAGLVLQAHGSLPS